MAVRRRPAVSTRVSPRAHQPSRSHSARKAETKKQAIRRALKKRKTAVASRCCRLHAKTTLITIPKKLLAQKDAELAKMKELLAQKDAELATMKELIAKKDAQTTDVARMNWRDGLMHGRMRNVNQSTPRRNGVTPL